MRISYIIKNISFLFFVILQSCVLQEFEKEIMIQTGEIVEIGITSVGLKGEIIDFGDGIDEYGHCWSISQLPTIEDEYTIVNENLNGEYISIINGLEEETIYYYAAYAKKGSKVVYGEVKMFRNLPYGIVAYYAFDGNTDDFSENKNNAINYGAELTTDRFGNENSAYFFDGLNDYMQLSKDINSSEGLTISFWLNSNGSQPNENLGTIICKYSMTGNVSRNFAVTSCGFLEENKINKITTTFYKTLYERDGVVSSWTLETIPEGFNSSLYSFENPSDIILNEWSFVVINLTSVHLEIWINGILTVKKIREFSNYSNDSSQPIYIGNNLNGGQGSNNHFHGDLDELRIYNRPLTVTEIQLLYHEGGWDN